MTAIPQALLQKAIESAHQVLEYPLTILSRCMPPAIAKAKLFSLPRKPAAKMLVIVKRHRRTPTDQEGDDVFSGAIESLLREECTHALVLEDSGDLLEQRENWRT